MRTRRSLQTTVLMLASGLTAFAGQGTECTAQTGAESEQERLSLSASIEEARRSPFHAGSGGETGAVRFGEMGIAGPTWYHSQESGAQEFRGPAFGFTFILAEVSHLLGAYLLLGCAYGHIPYGCVLGPALTVPVVALPAAVSGVRVGKALVASTVGLAGGIGAFVSVAHITERINDANLLMSALASGLVHAGISTWLIRRLDS